LRKTRKNLPTVKPYAPAGHKKTASNKWAVNQKNESWNGCKTGPTAFRSFRKTADWAVPRIIHWWLSAFTGQIYQFIFGRQVNFFKKLFCEKLKRLFSPLKCSGTRFSSISSPPIFLTNF